MILGFKKQFVPKIIKGSKIHTIREDKHNRWKPGMTIHFATGVRTKKYNQFGGSIAGAIQKIEITDQREVFVEGRKFNKYEIEHLAKNDGFNCADDFFKFFNKNFKGKIINWTEFKY